MPAMPTVSGPAASDPERRADARLIVATLASCGVTATPAAAEAAWAAFSAEVGQDWLSLPLDDDRIHIDAEAVLMACADHLGVPVPAFA